MSKVKTLEREMMDLKSEWKSLRMIKKENDYLLKLSGMKIARKMIEIENVKCQTEI